MNGILHDFRFALRQVRKSPGFTLTAILTLALGIGAAAAVFSVIDAVLLRPLPFANQERLVAVDTTAQAGYSQPWSYPSYVDARSELKSFEAFAGYSSFGSINLEAPSGPVSLPAVRSTDNFFNVFGVQPFLGRTYVPGENEPGKDDVAVLSYEVWQANFGGQPDAVGKVVRLDGTPYTVIGVMPAGFRYPMDARNAIYTPLHTSWRENRGTHWMRTVGLLKPGMSRVQAQADMMRLLTDIGRAHVDTDGGRTVKLLPLLEAVNGQTSGPLRTLLLAVLALLMIACVNVAGLLLARGVKREREVALRAAVGASKQRLVRQMLSESLVLSALGVIGGVAVGWVLLSAMRVFLVAAISRGAEVRMNMTVLLAALTVSVATSVLASLVPALKLSGTDPNHALRAGIGAGTGRAQHRLRSGFVVVQVALSLVLLVTSGLLLRNLRASLGTDLGFDGKKILALQIDLSPGRYEGRDPMVQFYRPLLERVSHLPGVEGAGVISILPIQHWGSNSDVHVAGQPPYPPNQEMLAETRLVSEGYFDAMGIKRVRGRMLSPSLDTPDAKTSAVVVNEAFQRKFFAGGGDAVGARLDNGADSTIVGVTKDVRQDLSSPPLAEMDWLIDGIPVKQRIDNIKSMMLVVRSSGDLSALTPSLRNAIHEVDTTVPFRTPTTMTEVVADQLVFQRLESWLFGIFAAFALLLAAIGMYGLINHEVELRTREIGIRMALGSTRAMVLGSVLRRVAVLLVVGLSSGWLLTVALRRVLSAVVEMRATHDAALLVALSVGLALVGLLAGAAPARKAASVEPMQALRSE